MKIEEIRRNAPEGSTHFLLLSHRTYFFKAKRFSILVHRNGKWKELALDSAVKWFFGWWYNEPDGLYVYKIRRLTPCK